MLTSLARAKALMGMSGDEDLPDSTLEPLLLVASVAIEEACRRTFKLQTYTDRADGMRGPYLQLKNYPVHSVSVFEKPDEPFNDVEVLDNGILFRRAGWPGGDRALTVTYTAGYVLPEDVTEENPATLPQTLEYACVLLVKHLMREPGVTSERVGDISVAYAADTGDMPMAVKALIAPHVRPEM